MAKFTGATLVIAKLDRLSRNAAFLLALRDSGVRFSAVNLPEANDLTVGIMALVPQAERERSPGAPGRCRPSDGRGACAWATRTVVPRLCAALERAARRSTR